MDNQGKLIEKIYEISIETRESIKWIKERLEKGDIQLDNHDIRIRNTEIWVGRLKGAVIAISGMATLILSLVVVFWKVI